ncbi:MAG: hypothetical protein EOO59_04755 [Hymenobacter sp.]|nr:MAG: hypothetical protein EOO59_04755 [Hymenobacter sp.]
MDVANKPAPWVSWLAGRRLFWLLLGLNGLATLAVAASAFPVASGDHYTYLGYADGLLHGRYSYWYFYPDYIPDTFRNPGYPLFLGLLKGLGLGEAGIRVVQVGLYAATIGLVLQLARRSEAPGSWLVRNLFLVLLLPNVQLAYFSALIFPEGPVGFLLAAYAVVALTWPVGSWRRTVGLALLAGLVFQCRPVFILFPLGQVALDFWLTRPRRAFAWGQAATFLLLYGATMLPYAAWNYRHHGVFKPTSLEGGAGVMQVGFWALRMPGYHETRYWGNQMGDEVVRFADSAQVPGYIAAFNHEWDIIDAQCRPLLTARDRHYLPLMRRDHGLLFPTYSTAYTQRREQLLMQANLADIRREPGYYLQTRLYTLVRLWVTGVQVNAWRAATTPVARLKVLYPALVSGLTFLVALLGIAWALVRSRWLRAQPTWWLALALVAYFGLVHLPFAIQARYTVPVRPWLLLATALALAAWLQRRALAGAQATARR